MLKKLIEIVKEAGNISLKYYGKIEEKQIQYKGKNDLVTSVDLEIEEFLKNKLVKYYPDSGFLGEEGKDKGENKNGKLFIADPIDGTTNFAYAHPFYCISLAYSENNIVKYGVVYAPVLDLLYSAERDGGAFCNSKRIYVSNTGTLKDSLGATGFACVFRNFKTNNLQLFNHIVGDLRGIRRYGSAAIDLCFTAEGKFDLYWEYNLNIWDIAAGVLIVKEAGGHVTDFDGENMFENKRQLLASNGKVHEEFLSKIGEIKK